MIDISEILFVLFINIPYRFVLEDAIIIFLMVICVFFFFKQKTAYEMRISDWSSDVCSSDLAGAPLCPIEDHGQMSQSRWTTTARMRATRGNKRPNQMYIP